MIMRHRGRGFTLVELLVAAAVIAVGMVYVLGAFGRCMTVLTTARSTVTATFLLDNKLWELGELYRQAGGADAGTNDGTFEEPNERFAWTQTASGVTAEIGDEFNQTSILRDLFLEETVRVAWRQGKAEREVSTTRYVIRRKP